MNNVEPADGAVKPVNGTPSNDNLTFTPIKRGERPHWLRRVYNTLIGNGWPANTQKGLPGQTCWTWCPGCDCDLCSQPNAFKYDHDGLVVYVCEVCGTRSEWDFCAPAPRLLAQGGSSNE